MNGQSFWRRPGPIRGCRANDGDDDDDDHDQDKHYKGSEWAANEAGLKMVMVDVMKL